ncbi:MAG: hypothetical protein WAQ98_17510 [Blastocatellia bacterium]
MNQKLEEIKKIIKIDIKLLSLRLSEEEFTSFGKEHFVFGLMCTWFVGIGRYWDDPGAKLLQHLGVGSVVYIFVLASLFWLIILPFKPKVWKYWHVLTFISLTSPPALLYAIPVERYFSLENSRTINVWFLAIVATWRVVLLFFYLKRYVQLKILEIIVVTLLPLTLIIFTLTMLNLERAVFNIMGGLRQPGTSNDSVYFILFVLSYLSMFLFVPLCLIYFVLIIHKKLVTKNI